MSIEYTDISTIIPNKLFLGNADAARDADLMRSFGVTHILNVCTPGAVWKEYANKKVSVEAMKNPIPMSWFPMIDGEGNDQEVFNNAMVRLKDLMNSGEIVFVHCRVGISRSATIIATYISEHFNKNIDEAFEFVKDKRSCIYPKEELKILARQYLSSLE